MNKQGTYICKYYQNKCTSKCKENEIKKCFKEHPEYFIEIGGDYK